MAIENMQRCVLAGCQPLPIAIESSISILTRWRSLMRKTLNGRLAGEMKNFSHLELPPESIDESDEDIPPTKHRNIPSISENQDEADEITEIIFDLLKNEPTETFFQRFKEAAKEIPEGYWLQGLAQIDLKENAAAFYKGIHMCIQLCKNDIANGLRWRDELHAIRSEFRISS